MVIPAFQRFFAPAALLVLFSGYLARPVPAGPKSPLEQARPFSLAGVDGKTHTLAQLRGRPAALFFYCGCEWCHKCARLWGQMQRSGALREPAHGRQPATVVIFSGTADEARAFTGETGLDAAQTLMLPDPRATTTLAYHATPCPRTYVIDGKGVIRYTNNHSDDAPQKGPEALIVARALDALRASSADQTGKTRKP